MSIFGTSYLCGGIIDSLWLAMFVSMSSLYLQFVTSCILHTACHCEVFFSMLSLVSTQLILAGFNPKVRKN
jgi:hypothetical protein